MTMMSFLLIAVAFLLTALLYPPLRHFASQVGLVDHPTERKQHGEVIPLVGGIGMATSFFLLYLLAPPGGTLYLGLLLGAAIVVVIGIWDDCHDLSSTLRFVAQILAAGAMILLDGVVLRDLGAILPGLGGAWQLGVLAIPLTIFATVGVINALNMIDGVDGLAGSVAFTTLLAIALLALLGGATAIALLALLLAATVAAFLLFNWRHTGRRKALLFMGDAGSMFLGFTIGWLFIYLSQGEERAFAPVTALWIFALPLIDTVTLMLRRILKRRSPFQADREHFHHLLLAIGFNAHQTVFILLGVSLLCTLFAIIAHLAAIPESIQFLLFLLLFAGHFWIVRRAWRVKRLLKRELTPFAPTQPSK